MNVLIDALPKHIMTAGEEIPIETDYKVWLEFVTKLMRGSLSEEEALELVVKIIGHIPSPEVTEEVVAALIRFFSVDAGEDLPDKKEERESKPPKKQKHLFDFEVDAEVIYTSFLQQYGIELGAECEMHWYKFRMLLDGLDEKTPFMKRVQLRNTDLKDVDKKNRVKVREAKAAIALDEMDSGYSTAGEYWQAQRQYIASRYKETGLII